MESSMKNYKKLIKTIFNDVLFLYKNFIHWNISKIFISISSFVLWIITSLPFFLVLIFIMWLDPIAWRSIFSNSDVNLSLDALRMIQDNIVFVFFEGIILVLGIGIFLLASSYKIILQLYLTRNYLKNKLLPYKENIYFNKASFLSYIKVVWWQWLYILVPIGISIGIIFFFFLISVFLVSVGWNIKDGASFLPFVNTPLFYVLSALLFVCLLIFFYLIYKMSFSFFILVDKIESQKNTAIEIVKKSFSLTHWYKIFLTIASTFVIFWFIMLPFFWISAYLEDETKNMSDYINFSHKQEQQKIDENDLSELEDLKILYSAMSLWAVEKRLTLFNWIQGVYSFFIFLVFSGYMEMVSYSLYNNFLNKQKFKFL